MNNKTELAKPTATRINANPRQIAVTDRAWLACHGRRTAVVSGQSINYVRAGLQRRRPLFVLSLLVLALLPLRQSVAEQPAYYAGLAYLGDFSYIDANYPMTQALNDGGGGLDRALAEALRASAPDHLELRYTLGDLDRTDTLVLAVALDRERVSREVLDLNTGLRTKLIVEVSLQVLLYDLAGGYLINNVPISAAVNHVLEGNVRDVEREALRLAERLYLGDGEDPGLLARAVRAITQLRPANVPGLRYQLASVAVGQRVAELLPGHIDERLFGQRLGQFFSARLGEQTQVSVIPFTRGYAIGNQLPGRFSNGEAFNLALPEPDYAFHVELKNLTRHETETELLFGAQTYFRLEEPFTGAVFIAGDYRAGVYKPAADFRVEADDWSAYEDAAENLLDDLVSQLRSPDRAWHKQHARSPESFSQFNAKKELFND
ncbi:MAG: hypothetical protein AAFX56_19635 [Pseudomonadota bacterium]